MEWLIPACNRSPIVFWITKSGEFRRGGDVSCACTTARIADSTATARERSLSSWLPRWSDLGLEFVTIDEAVRTRSLNYGRAPVYTEKEEIRRSSSSVELPRQIPAPLENLPEERIARRIGKEDKRKLQGFFIYGPAR